MICWEISASYAKEYFLYACSACLLYIKVIIRLPQEFKTKQLVSTEEQWSTLMLHVAKKPHRLITRHI